MIVSPGFGAPGSGYAPVTWSAAATIPGRTAPDVLDVPDVPDRVRPRRTTVRP
ncbi:hypothetical protein ACPCBC_19385 [Streptomyces incarnatus]|nr:MULTISPECIES: hypothetical protein [Streptomyces]